MPWHDTNLLLFQGENAICDLMFGNNFVLKNKILRHNH